MLELLERLVNPASVEDKPDLTPDFYPPAEDFEAFEAQFKTPEEEQDEPGTSKRVVAALGVMAAVAGGVGYQAGHPAEDALQVSADQITQDLNSGDRTTDPVIIEKGSELIVPKEDSDDKTIKVINPIRLSDDTYGALIFEDNKATVIEVPADAVLKPVETEGDDAESHEIVYPVSVVYTEVPAADGKTERVYSAVAGDDSGNAANAVKIDADNATSEQKRLLADKNLRGLLKDTIGLASQERVGYPVVED